MFDHTIRFRCLRCCASSLRLLASQRLVLVLLSDELVALFVQLLEVAMSLLELLLQEVDKCIRHELLLKFDVMGKFLLLAKLTSLQNSRNMSHSCFLQIF